jgi:hypothetical protein
MLAHNLKEILTLIPEASELVKQASIEEEFPTNNKDSVCASYLRMNYLTKVANLNIAPETKSKIIKAASLYQVRDRLDTMSRKFNPSLEKTASQKADELIIEFEDSVGNPLGLEKIASLAEAIVDQDLNLYNNPMVDLYAVKGWLNKEAAVKTLANRFYQTKDQDFVKIARMVLDNVREDDQSQIRQVCRTVTQLDKRAGLDLIGFNFYKEALITKEAAFKSVLKIKLLNKEIPYETIAKFGKERIGQVLGSSVSEGMNDDPVNNKYLIESLPKDLQTVLVKVLNV